MMHKESQILTEKQTNPPTHAGMQLETKKRINKALRKDASIIPEVRKTGPGLTARVGREKENPVEAQT